MIDDPYAVLGVARDASAEQIHEAYFALARQCHPDARPDDPLAAEKFRRVHGAFEVLDCPAARAKYDSAWHPVERPVTANAAEAPPAPTVNWEYLLDRARRHKPDPCAADMLYWPAVWLLLLGLASIPIDLVVNKAIYNAIYDQPSKTEQAEYTRVALLDAFPLFCVVQTACGLLAIAGAVSMFRVWSYPIALLGLVAASLPGIGALYGLGIVIAIWWFWEVYEEKGSFRY